jgi:hypothetical protein
MIITWDATYEAQPTDSLGISLIDNVIRDIAFGIRERMSIEHEWGSQSTLNDGSHILGGTTVMSTGDAATMYALTGMQEGALYLQNTGIDINLMIYQTGTWTIVSTLDHEKLTGRTNNDHPQYVLKNDVNLQNTTINMNGFMIKAFDTVSPSCPTLKYHAKQQHPTWENIATIVNNTIDMTKVRTQTQIDTYSILHGTYVFWTPNQYEFFPAIYCLNNKRIVLVGGSGGLQLGLYNAETIGTETVKVYREWIY